MTKTLLVISMLILSGGLLKAQLGPHKALQTQKGNSLNTFNLIEGNPILEKVVQKTKGLEFHFVNKEKSFLKWKEIETTSFGFNEFHFDAQFEDMSVSLFYKPHPDHPAEQLIQYGIIKTEGWDKNHPEATTYFKVIFAEDLRIQ